MSRLTKNISDKQTYCGYEVKDCKYQQIYGFKKYRELEDYVDCDLTLAIDKLGQLEDLEEQLGCPLEVYVGINQCDITTVYDKNGIEYTIKHDTIIKNSFMAVDGFTLIECMWNMYCKTWWLKKDKSE